MLGLLCTHGLVQSNGSLLFSYYSAPLVCPMVCPSLRGIVKTRSIAVRCGSFNKYAKLIPCLQCLLTGGVVGDDGILPPLCRVGDC